VDPSDPTRVIDAPPGTVNPSVLRNYTFQAPDPSLGCTTTPSANCNVVPAGVLFTPIGGDTQFIYNIEYRVPVISVLSIAAFADIGSAFNARKYNDQVVSTNFVNQNITSYGSLTGATITSNGVLLNPSGRIATAAEIASAPVDFNGSPIGFRPVLIQGEAQDFSIVGTSVKNVSRIFSDVRSSMGLEFRVQMPVINVPFRLIFAYNPQAKTDVTDPTVLFIERRTVVRFSVGRTF
jgi:outer membrane protein insertion porin family